MSAYSSALLAREIHDQFLVCKICFSAYKKPKCLDCMHTFCEKCIEDQFNAKSSSFKQFTSYCEFICPVCHKRTSIPSGGAHKLPDNFIVSNLLRLIGPQCPDVSRCPACDICKKVMRKHREATAKCLDCVKLMCGDCARIHSETKVTSGHSIFGIQVEKDIQCKEHPEEAVRFYCIPCDACVCVLCTFNKHIDHRVIQFTEAVSNCREHIGKLLASCKDRSRNHDHWMEAVTKCEEVITVTTQKIKDAAIQYLQEIRDAEERLLDELHQMIGPEVMNQLDRKKEIISVVEGMRATCDLSDIIIGGKDMELLLLKKDVEEKLKSMNAIQVEEFPEDHGNRIEYVPGTVDFGHLFDCDRSVPIKIPTRRKSRSGRPTTDAGSQTGQEGPEQSGGRKQVVATKVNTGTMTESKDGGGRNMDSEASPLSPLLQSGLSPVNLMEQNEPIRRRRREPNPAANTST